MRLRPVISVAGIVCVGAVAWCRTGVSHADDKSPSAALAVDQPASGAEKAASAFGETAAQSTIRSPDENKPAPQPPLRFRRVFVPEARIDDWPRGNLRYLPLDAVEFEKMLDRAKRATTKDRSPSEAQVVRAVYEAELTENELVGGRATLEIRSFRKEAGLLSLDPCSLAIDSPRWIADGSAESLSLQTATKPANDISGASAAAPATARRSATGDSFNDDKSPSWGIGADGKLAMRVGQSGRLQFNWTLRGQAEAGGALAFALRLPQCPSNKLRLTLPKDYVPTTEQAIITPLPIDDRPVGAERPNQAAAASHPATGRWLIEFGGQNLSMLRVAKRDLVHERRPLTLVRQNLIYDFSPRGLQLSADLKLDVLGEPIRQIPLDLDSSLTLVTARYGDAEIPWSEETTPETDHGLLQLAFERVQFVLDDLGLLNPLRARHRRVVLQLPEPLRGAGRTVRLGAVAPLPSGGRLPSIQPATSEMLWQEGTATLLTASPLELNDLRTSGCRQTKQEPLPRPEQGEAITLQYFRPDADVNITLSRRPDRIEIQSGTVIEVRGTTITGRSNVDVTARNGECFSMAATVPPSWIIDSVESAPSGNVANWSVDPPAGGAARLTVSLTRGVRADRSLRLTVTGRWRRSPLGETLKADDLQLLNFQDVKVGRRLVAIRAAAPYRLQLAGAENLGRLDPDRLEPADAALLGPSIGGTVFVADRGAAALAVKVGKETPKHSGEIHILLKVADDSLTESYTLTCAPQSAAIDRLLVHFSLARSEALRWTMLGDRQDPDPENAELISARRLSADSQAGMGFPAGEVWELTWRQPRSQPFKIQATRTIPLESPTPISLAGFVQATAQHATVEIRSVAEHVPEIDNRRLKPAVTPAAPADRWTQTLAAFQYEPQEEAVLAATDPLPSLTIGPGKSLPGAWVWMARLDSHYSTAGHSEHMASWWIENSGRSDVSFQMPRGTMFHAAWIDGALASTTASDAIAGRIQLRLPVGRRFTMVVMKWAAESPPLSIVSPQTAEFPEAIDLPVLSRRVNLWLPPNFQLIRGDSNDDATSAPAPSWSQRLFGPLGRPAGQAVFDPLSTDDWTNLTSSVSERGPAWVHAQQIIERLSALQRRPQSSAETRGMTWGEVLAQVRTEIVGREKDQAVPFLIDQPSLADIGILPQTLLPSADASGDRGASILDDADLTLLVATDAVLLTTRSVASRWGGVGSTAIPSVCRRAAPGPLREQLRSAAAGNSSRFVPAEVWGLPELMLPWADAAIDPQAIDHVGWTVYRLESAGSGPERIWLVRHDAIVALGCAFFLLSALIVSRKQGLSLKVKGAVFVVATVVALTVPDSFTPIGAGVWMGIVCGWLIELLAIGGRWQLKSADGRPAQRVGASASQVAAIVLLVSIAGPGFVKSAEPIPPVDAAPNAAIYDVLIPTDDQQHPKGNDYLVPEPFYDELVRRAGRAAAPEQDWLIASAAYRGRLARESQQTVAPTGDWTADFDLETFRPRANVQIPFGGEGTNLAPDGVRLDDGAIQFEWKNSERSLAIEVPLPGRHHLALTFRPSPRTVNSVTDIDLSIPSLPISRLELDYPNDVRVEIPSAKGHLTRDIRSGRITGSLGPADRLSIRCGEAARSESKPPVADVDELLWLRIRPGSVVLETRFSFRVAEGKLLQVQLLADPRLRRLPLEGGSPIAQVRSEPGDLHTTIYLGLATPIVDQVAFKVSFLLTDTSGIGNLRLPKLDVVGARILSRRLAVSIESPLETNEKQIGAIKSIPVSDFLSAWGAAESKPQLAFQLPEGETSCNLAIHPRQPQLTSSDELTASLEHDRIRATWMTDLTVQGGSIYQLHLSAPRQFNVESALLRDGAADRPLRWSRGVLGGVTLFLPGPPAERYRLLVRGWMPYPIGKIVQLPDLRADGCNLDARTILTFRNSEVLATLSNRSGLSEQSEKDSQQAIERALSDGLLDASALAVQRVVTCLAGKPTAAPVAMQITPNAPHIAGVERTTMRRGGDTWTAAVDLDLKISGGVLDALRFDLPAQWSAATEISPTMASEMVDVPGESRKQLVLRPAEPLIGTQHIRLSGPVAVAAGQRLRVPDIRPVGLGPLRRFVLLPTNSNEQQLAWEQRGLNVEPLPGSFIPNSPRMEVYRTCQVIGDSFEATLKSIEKAIERPRVRLADIRVTSLSDQTGFGTAAFDLESAGATGCLLEMPPEDHLLQVRANDAPAVLKRIAGNRWSVSAGGGKLPQRIEIVFLVDRPAGEFESATRTYRAPSLLGYSVDQTLWTLAGSPGAVAKEGQRRVKSVSPLEWEIIQLEAASSLLDSAASVLSDETVQPIAEIFAPWARRYLAARAAVERERARNTAAMADPAANAVLHSVDEAEAKLARKLGTQPLFDDRSGKQRVADEATDIWKVVEDEDLGAAMFSVTGSDGLLVVTYSAESVDGLATRLLIALVGAIAVAAAFWLVGRPGFREALVRWPYWIAGLGGVLWWLWLAPSVVGIAIIAASLGFAYWEKRTRRDVFAPGPPRMTRGRSSVVTAPASSQRPKV
ncbi:MAG TPA: hypothetical protein VGY55_16730 [Pirellulales bacterium]|jgi:hypothetical protein|nr:hypothetical protein [Pirellulales bacterium]